MNQLPKLKYLLPAAMLSLTILASVSAQAAEYKGVIGAGLDFGGDTLATAVYTDGTTTDVKTNQGFTINGGAVMIIAPYETQLTVGYKFGGPQAKNGSITWDVIPIEIIQFIRASNMRVGLGFSYHNNPKLVVDIPGTSSTVKYDDALGTVVQVGWAPADLPFSIDLRYTAIKYRQSNASNAQEKSGNVLGIYSSFYF